MSSLDTDAPKAERLSIGYVAGAHGIQGGVRIQLLHPGSLALGDGSTVWLTRRDTNEELGQFKVTKLERVPGKSGSVAECSRASLGARPRMRFAGARFRCCAETCRRSRTTSST